MQEATELHKTVGASKDTVLCWKLDTKLHETVDESKKVQKMRFVTWQRWLELEQDALKVHYASTDNFATQK